MSIFGKFDPTKHIPGMGGKGPKIPGVSDAEREIKKAINTAKDEALKDIEKAAKQAVDHIPNEVEKAIEQGLEGALEKFFELASKGVMSKFLSIAKAAAPDTLWGPTVGPVSFTISEVPKKMDQIVYWAEHPPTDKARLKKMINEVKPDTVEITIKFSAPIVDSISIGGTLVYNTDTFLKRMDTLWNAARFKL